MENIRSKIIQEKLIVIIRGVPADKLVPLCNALFKGGIRLVELPFDATGYISDEEISSMISLLCEEFSEKLVVGAGTVLSINQVKLAKKSGAKFIVSPDTNLDVIEATKKLGLISIPGALTPTEIRAASVVGADFVKIFPISSMPSDYLKLITLPLGRVKMLAVGNVNKDNIKEYLNAGAVGACIGSYLVPKDLIALDDYDAIAERAGDLVKYIIEE